MTSPDPRSQIWRWEVQKLLDLIQSTATNLAAVVTALQATVAALQTQVNNLFTNVTGIQFAATQVSSSNVNTLDDYEEGTWTPALAASSGTITSYTSSGVYTKIGRLVFVEMDATITNNGTGAGAINVGGLPFTPSGNSSGGGREIAVVGHWIQATINTSTTMTLFKYDNTYPGGTNWQLRIAATYHSAT